MRPLGLDEAETRLREGPLVVRREGDVLHVAWPGEPPEALVRFRSGDDVRRTAAMLARRDEIPALAACDRQYWIVLPDLEAALVQTNTLAELQMTLGDLADGFVRNEWNGLYQPRDGVPPPRPPFALEAWTKASAAELDAFRVEVRASGIDGALDLSYESLDVVEDALGVLAPEGVMPRALRDRAARYVGATLIAQRGGRWAVGGDSHEGEPVVEVPSLPKTRPFRPLGVVVSGARLRGGRLRDETEHWDLPRGRARLAELLARRDDELRQLEDDVALSIGEPRAPLDASESSLDRLQRALAQLCEPGVSRERKRAVRERAMLHLGTLVERARPGATWSIREAPADVDFGQPLVDGWSPTEAVRVARPSAAAGLLARRVAAAMRSTGARKSPMRGTPTSRRPRK